MTTLNDLSDDQIVALLQQMAAANPDIAVITTQSADLHMDVLDADTQQQLAREVFTLLADDSQQTNVIQNLLNQPLQQFEHKNTRIPLLIVLIVVLGAKVEFNHNTDGTQSFHFQYDGDNTAVVQLLKKIENLLPKTKK